MQAWIDERAGGDIVNVTEPAPRKFVRIGVRRHAATGVISLEQTLTVWASGQFDWVTLHRRDSGGWVEDTRASNRRTALKQQDDDILHGPP